MLAVGRLCLGRRVQGNQDLNPIEIGRLQHRRAARTGFHHKRQRQTVVILKPPADGGAEAIACRVVDLSNRVLGTAARERDCWG